MIQNEQLFCTKLIDLGTLHLLFWITWLFGLILTFQSKSIHITYGKKNHLKIPNCRKSHHISQYWTKLSISEVTSMDGFQNTNVELFILVLKTICPMVNLPPKHTRFCPFPAKLFHGINYFTFLVYFRYQSITTQSIVLIWAVFGLGCYESITTTTNISGVINFDSDPFYSGFYRHGSLLTTKASWLLTGCIAQISKCHYSIIIRI